MGDTIFVAGAEGPRGMHFDHFRIGRIRPAPGVMTRNTGDAGGQEVASSILASSTIDSAQLTALQLPRQLAWWHGLVARRPVS